MRPARIEHAAVGQRHVLETFDQQSFRLVEGAGQRVVDGTFDQALRLLDAVPHREHRGRTDRLVDIAQRHLAQIAGDAPAAAVALVGTDVAALAQSGQHTPHQYRIGAQEAGQLLGSERPVAVRHMQQHVQDGR